MNRALLSGAPFSSSSWLCNGYVLPPFLVLSRRIDPKYLGCHYRAVALCGSVVRGTLHVVHEFTTSWLSLGLILTSFLSALFFISFYFFGTPFTFMTLIQHQVIRVHIPYRLFSNVLNVLRRLLLALNVLVCFSG